MLLLTPALLALGGCTADYTTEDSATDTGEPAAGPCADGGWGEVTSPSDAVHVRSDGDDGDDGSARAPLATFGAALDLARSSGTRTIALGPGTWSVTATLTSPDDDGLEILGCSATETVLEASDSSEPILLVAEVVDFRLAGVQLLGGDRALRPWQGATGTLQNVVITEATSAGIAIDGPKTSLTLEDVEIRDITQGSGTSTRGGYGIAVSDGTLVMSGGGTWEATLAGIAVSGGTVDLERLTVADTRTSSRGTFGRGIHLHNMSTGRIADVTLSGLSDAALFSQLSLGLEVEALVIDEVSAVAVPGSTGTTGDAIVLIEGDDDMTYDPADLEVTLSDCELEGADRAGVVVEDVLATLSDNQIADCGLDDEGTCTFTQGIGEVAGTTDFLALDEALELNRDELDVAFD